MNDLKTTKQQLKYIDVTILVVLIIVFGFCSLYKGQDFSWDLRNSHYYNGWAFLNNRLINVDITPSNGLHGYFNPLLDGVEYFLLNLLGARMFAFIFGAISGISAYFCYKICAHIFYLKRNQCLTIVYIIGAFIISVTGFANSVQIGLSCNESIAVSFFIAGIYFLIFNNHKKIMVLVSYLSLGFAAGLKLTVAIPVFAALFIHFLYNSKNINNQLRFTFLILCSIVLGFYLSGGWWMVKMYHIFGNPFYPNFSNIFTNTPNEYHVPWVKDQKFLPKDVTHWLFTPFFLMKINILTAELPMRDWRFGITFICMICYFILNKLGYAKSLTKKESYIFLFFVTNYVLWLIMFSIQRYTIQLEYMTGIIIFSSINKLSVNRYIKQSLMLTSFILILSQDVTSDWGHVPFTAKIYSTGIKINNSLVVFTEPGLSYIAPDLGNSNIYINSPDFWLTSKYHYQKKNDLIKAFVHNKQPIYIIAHDYIGLSQIHWLQNYGFRIDHKNCRKTVTLGAEIICRVN